MSEVIINGMNGLLFGEPTADGTMPLDDSMSALFRTYRDSVEVNTDAPKTSEEFCDQQDDPFFTKVTKGGRTIKAVTFNYENPILLAMGGGTVVNGQWAEPVVQPAIYKAVKITPDTGVSFNFPRCRVWIVINPKFVKDKVALLEVYMKPEPLAGKSPLLIGNKTP